MIGRGEGHCGEPLAHRQCGEQPPVGDTDLLPYWLHCLSELGLSNVYFRACAIIQADVGWRQSSPESRQRAVEGAQALPHAGLDGRGLDRRRHVFILRGVRVERRSSHDRKPRERDVAQRASRGERERESCGAEERWFDGTRGSVTSPPLPPKV